MTSLLNIQGRPSLEQGLDIGQGGLDSGSRHLASGFFDRFAAGLQPGQEYIGSEVGHTFQLLESIELRLRLGKLRPSAVKLIGARDGRGLEAIEVGQYGVRDRLISDSFRHDRGSLAPAPSLSREAPIHPIPGVLRAHQKPAARATNQAGKEGRLTTACSSGVGDLGSFVQVSRNEGSMGLGVRPRAEAQLPQVGAVSDHVGGIGDGGLEEVGQGTPWFAGGAHLEGSDDLPGVRSRHEPSLAVLDESQRWSRGGPDSTVYSTSLGVSEGVSVAPELHVSQAEDHVAGHLSFGGGGVEVLGHRDHFPTVCLDSLDDADCVVDSESRQAVQLSDDDPLVGTFCDSLKGLGEDRSLHPSPGDVEFGLQHLDPQSVGGGIGFDPVSLKLGADEPLGSVPDPRNTPVARPHGLRDSTGDSSTPSRGAGSSPGRSSEALRRSQIAFDAAELRVALDQDVLEEVA